MSSAVKYTYFKSSFRLHERPNYEGSIAPHKIYAACQQFGPVNFIHGEFDSAAYWTRVCFMRTAKTDELRPQSEIDIDGHRRTIEWLNDKPVYVERDRVAESLQTPPDQQSPQHILNRLDDKCLRMIFESSCLSVDTLCAVGNVCSRFNEIATQVFVAKYKDPKRWLDMIRSKSLWRIEQFLRVAPITSLYYHGLDGTEYLLEQIAKNCKHLKELDWTFQNQSDVTVMGPVLDKMTTLAIKGRGAIDFTGVITPSASLTSLSVNGLCSTLKLPNVQLPKLTNLNYEAGGEMTATTEQFLHMNPQLKSLTYVCSLRDTRGLERTLGHLPNLDELLIADDRYYRSDDDPPHYDFAHLRQLNGMKVLHFEGYGQRMAYVLREIIDGQVPVERLILDDPGRGNCFPITEIGELRTVKCLIIGRLENDSLAELLNGCDNIPQIEIFSQRLTLAGICDALRLVHRSLPTKIRLFYDYKKGCDWSDLDDIYDVRQERGIALEIVVHLWTNPYIDYGAREQYADILAQYGDWVTFQYGHSFAWYIYDYDFGYGEDCED